MNPYQRVLSNFVDRGTGELALVEAVLRLGALLDVETNGNPVDDVYRHLRSVGVSEISIDKLNQTLSSVRHSYSMQ